MSGAVLLRSFEPRDVDAHLAGEDDEIRARFRFPRPSTRADVAAFVERSAAFLAAGAPRRTWAVVEQASGELCGHVESLHLGAGAANISYSLYPRFRGRGLAVPAVRLCLADAEAALPVDRFVIRVEPDNAASIRVAERCGFSPGGEHREGGVRYLEYRLDLLARTGASPRSARSG